MNLEKVIFMSIIGFVMAGVYLGINRPQARDLTGRKIVPEAELVADFDLKEVLDNTPFKQYYAVDDRNPFVPTVVKVAIDPTAKPVKVKKTDDGFIFNNTKPKPKPPVKPPPKRPQPPKRPSVREIVLPAKPAPEDDQPAEKVTKATVKKDDTIPVYLIGFAKTFTESSPNRKAILANKKTQEVYTVQKGDQLKQFGLTIVKITPFSIIIRMKNGRKVEFLNDVLKE